jgi:predicted Rossmann fold nucleotide-binding protein DprA/Smf involved in DNA uptake
VRTGRDDAVQRGLPGVSAEEERLLQAVGNGPRPTDLLARECALPRPAFLRALFALEQRGALARLPGDLWRRADGLTNR